MNLEILPEARSDGSQAAWWYERQRPGLGTRFLTAFDHCLSEISESPGNYPQVEYYHGKHELRRCRFLKFPYHVVFEVRGEKIFVLAVCHNRRRPAYWAARVTE